MLLGYHFFPHLAGLEFHNFGPTHLESSRVERVYIKQHSVIAANIKCSNLGKGGNSLKAFWLKVWTHSGRDGGRTNLKLKLVELKQVAVVSLTHRVVKEVKIG